MGRRRNWAAGVAGALILGVTGCQEKEEPLKAQYKVEEPVTRQVMPLISESSGIADSRQNPGYLWVQEDGGNPTQLYLLGHNGEIAGTVHLKGSRNRDWEDIALANGRLYIADIGDNNATYDSYEIYSFPEPLAKTDTVYTYETIRFSYPDGPRDAEAFIVDPVTNDIYIITKREQAARIYKLTYPYNLQTTHTTRLVGTLPYSNVVSAAISPDGNGILIKTYTGIMHYKRNGNQPIEAALKSNPIKLPYVMEPQGEALSLSVTGKGYFTLSEKGFSTEQRLYYYKLTF